MKSVLRLTAVAALAVAITAPSVAFAFRASNYLRVNPEGPGTFEVIQSGGISAADAWCAAGEFAIRRLGVAGNQPIYLVEGRHFARTEQRRRYAYSFSVTPPPEAANFTRGIIRALSLRNVGDSMRAASARQFCDNRLGNDEWERG